MLKIFSALLFSAVLAVTNPQSSGDIVNSATIADSTVTAPILRTPTDDSITNNRYEQFSWTRSTCDTGVSHYNLYLDDIIVASHIAHSTAIDNIIYTTLTTPISDGEHTWYVIAYGSQGNSATSETHTFTVDATNPIIILLAVDKTAMYWATNDPYTIPAYDQRHLTVTNKNPLLSGKVEALSNLKLSLCQGSDPCHETITINDPDGEWEHRFYNLEPNITYFAYLSATDAAGNSNIFPTFTIQYTPIPILLRLIKDPERGPTLTGAAPAAGPLAIEPKEGRTPEVPPPPPQKPSKPVIPTPVIPAQAGTYLIPLSLLTLLAHLAMTAFGASIKLSLFPKLLYSLFIPPFLILKDDITLSLSLLNQTTVTKPLPFTTLSIYSLKHPLKKIVTDINGRFNLKLKKQDAYRIVASHPGYTYPDKYIKPHLQPQQQPYIYHSEPIIIDKNNFTSSDGKWIIPLDLKPKDSLTPLERLQIQSTSLRSLPLGLSIMFSIFSIIFIPSVFTITFFAIITNITLNQYLYPHLSSQSS